MKFVAVLAALVVAVMIVSPAFGHAAPERFNPAPGAVLETAPVRIEGFYTQDIRREQGASFIRVFDEHGQRVDAGDVVINDDDRRHMYVGLESDLPGGRYLVAWQTLSDEDDELDGSCFLFFVGQEAADLAHEDRVRIDDPESCPIDLEGATALFGNPDGGGHDHGSDEGSAQDHEMIDSEISLDVSATVEGASVSINVETDNFQIRLPQGNEVVPGFGHFHYYLNEIPDFGGLASHQHGEDEAQGLEGVPGSQGGVDQSGSEGGGDATPPSEQGQSAGSMVFENRFDIRNLDPGNHVVTVVLFDDLHQPLSPIVAKSVSFVIPVAEGRDIPVGTLVGGTVAAAAGGLAVGGVGVFMVRRRT